MTRPDRAAGVLLHPTSLPGLHGIGDLGAGAYRFVEFLEDAGQSLWQVMPLGPVGAGNSPYAATSSFAGNPLLITLDQLVGRGWLQPSQWDGPSLTDNAVDYAAASQLKHAALGRGWEHFKAGASSADRAELDEFCRRHEKWLDDYALFMALKEAHGGGGWFEWEPELALRDHASLEAARRYLADRIAFHRFSQWVFFAQWSAVRRYANARSIRIIGDIPIFVAHDSADVWVNRDLFCLDQRGQPTVVAGVPPDAFSTTGQRWGNPLYNWQRLAESGYSWWIDRFRATLEMVDVIRLDHFRGFQAYWEVLAQQETAVHGRWVEGPSDRFFAAVAAALGRLPMIVEDLGEITPDVIELRERLGFPGMKVLQFAFGEDAGPVPTGKNPYLPHNYQPDCVVYTGTHDNDTTVGWFHSLDAGERTAVLRYVGTEGHDIAWDLIRLALGSVADWSIVPLQDVMSLGTEARMNVPGRFGDNWRWRYPAEALTVGRAQRLAELTATYGRSGTRREN